MTKIPTVRERYEEKFGWAGSSGTFSGIRDEEIVKFITAEREAGARDERARIYHKLLECIVSDREESFQNIAKLLLELTKP